MQRLTGVNTGDVVGSRTIKDGTGAKSVLFLQLPLYPAISGNIQRNDIQTRLSSNMPYVTSNIVTNLAKQLFVSTFSSRESSRKLPNLLVGKKLVAG